jgi:energy-coupling factor transporter ATP-binding protein EcfA2
VASRISHEDLMKECGIDDSKAFGRFLKTNGIAKSSNYDKKTANDVAWRVGRRIQWYTYRDQQGDPETTEPLRRGISSSLLDRVAVWYDQLSPAKERLALDQPHILGLVCMGGFLEGKDRQEFLVNLSSGMNVFIGDRGSGKSTILNLLGVLAGSVGEGTHILVEKLLSLADSSEVEFSEFASRVRRMLRTYDLRLFVSYFCRDREPYCCIIVGEGNWVYELLVRRNDSWIPVENNQALASFPLQFFHQGEVTTISESGDEFYLNKVIDSLHPELNRQRTELARNLLRLNQQYFHYTKSKPHFDFSAVEEFIEHRQAELERMESQAEGRGPLLSFKILDRWIATWQKQNRSNYSTILDFLQTKDGGDIYRYFLAPIIDLVRSSTARVSQLADEYRRIKEESGGAESTEVSQTLERVVRFEELQGREVLSIVRAIRNACAPRLKVMRAMVRSYRKIDVVLDRPLESLIIEFCEVLQDRLELMHAQESECTNTAEMLKQDGLDVRMYSPAFGDRVEECRRQIRSLQAIAKQYTEVLGFGFKEEHDSDCQPLDEVTSKYQVTLNGFFATLEQLKERDVQKQRAHDFLFEHIEIELRQGDAYRGFQNLSFGQRCGIILKLVLRTDDSRILVLDQPEDTWTHIPLSILLPRPLRNSRRGGK